MACGALTSDSLLTNLKTLVACYCARLWHPQSQIDDLLESFTSSAYNSLILLGKLIQTMGEWGLPKAIRSDNDAVFKTKLFRWTLKLIGVQQQWTEVGSPWQNGRVERFWRTFKEGVLEKRESIKDGLIAIKTQFKFADTATMTQTLLQFQHLYNTQRPHQSLKGKTPAMVWNAGKEKALQKQAARAPPWLRW